MDELGYMQHEISKISKGMLRDYFAGQALNGLMSAIKIDIEEREIAEMTYKIADEMIKARDETT